MPLWCHEGEGLVVSVEDHNARRELDPTRQRTADEGHLTRGDAGQRGVEAISLGPELLVVILPGLDDLDGRNLGTHKGYPVGLLPHLSESLQWPDGPAAVDVDVGRAIGDACDLERLGVLCPVGRVTRLALPSLSRLVLWFLFGHRVPPL